MNRTGKILAISVLAGAGLGLAGGILWYRAQAAPCHSLEEVLWLVDDAGRLHSPTSAPVREVLVRWAAAGVDIHSRTWSSEVFLNASAEPDVIAKTFRIGPPVEAAQLDAGPRAGK